MGKGGLPALTVEPTSEVDSLIKRVVRRGIGIGLGVIALTTLTNCQAQSPQTSPSSPEPSPSQQLQQPLNSPLAAPPPPPAGAYLGKISPDVSSQLQGLPLLAPAYVPTGFVLAEYGKTPDNGYYLIYRSADQCFAIEHTNLSQTPPPPADLASLPVKSFDSPLFGSNRSLYYSQTELAPAKLISQWLTSTGGAYRLAGADVVQTYTSQPPCQNVPINEAVDIVASMTDLTVTPTDAIDDY